jgi:hypothetical protein
MQRGMPQVDIRQHLAPLSEELTALKREIYGSKQQQVQSQIDQFFSDPANRYADNVAEQMVKLIRTGEASNLKEAYDTACWMQPEVRAEILKEQRAAEAAQQAAATRKVTERARTAAKSINGGPATTTLPGTQTDDLRAQLEEAFRGSARA